MFTKSAALAWIRQPTSVAALATLAGTAVALSLHQMTVDAALAITVGALVGLIIPDNAGARTGALTLAADALAVARSPNTLTIGRLASDAATMAVAVQSTPSGATATVAISANSAEEAASAGAAVLPALAQAVEDAR